MRTLADGRHGPRERLVDDGSSLVEGGLGRRVAGKTPSSQTHGADVEGAKPDGPSIVHPGNGFSRPAANVTDREGRRQRGQPCRGALVRQTSFVLGGENPHGCPRRTNELVDQRSGIRALPTRAVTSTSSRSTPCLRAISAYVRRFSPRAGPAAEDGFESLDVVAEPQAGALLANGDELASLNRRDQGRTEFEPTSMTPTATKQLSPGRRLDLRRG